MRTSGLCLMLVFDARNCKRHPFSSMGTPWVLPPRLSDCLFGRACQGKSRPWLLLLWTDPDQSSTVATSPIISRIQGRSCSVHLLHQGNSDDEGYRDVRLIAQARLASARLPERSKAEGRKRNGQREQGSQVKVRNREPPENEGSQGHHSAHRTLCFAQCQVVSAM